MIIEKLHEVLELIVDLDDQLELQAHLETVENQLQNVVNAPAVPAHQAALAGGLEKLRASVAELSKELSHVDASYIDELGGGKFFAFDIANNVQTWISNNAITPSVALGLVRDFTSSRSEFLSNVKSTLGGLNVLGVEDHQLKAGSADMAFLIPRSLFDEKLEQFAKELQFIDRLVSAYGEAVTGKPDEITVESLSSSVPTISLLANPRVIEVISKVVKLFLDAWEKIERIRGLRNELAEVGLKGKALEELTEQVTTTVEEIVEESTTLALANYGGDQGRRNELENSIRGDTRRLFGQIERGLVVQFRANQGEAEAEPEEVTAALQNIDRLGNLLIFPKASKEPVLLANGEVLEGEILISKKSKVTKSTTTKKVQPARTQSK